MGGVIMRVLRAIAVLVATLAATAAAAQSYPSRPVRIVVPFAAGGPADIYARVVGEKLQGSLGQPFVVENRPGGGAIVGTDAVAKSAPDGYTLLMMSNTHTVNESLFAEKPYQLMRDLVPVAPVNYSDLVLVVHPSVPAATLAEFIALAKAKPGGLNYASSGPGTPYHMAGELFKAMANVSTMAPHVRAGKLQALATSGKTRSQVLPEVPTLNEAGVPGYDAVIWLGFMAPAGTPRPIVDKLNAEITRAVNAPEMREAWAKQGAIAMSMTPEEFARFLREDIEKWARIVKISGAKPDQ